MAVILVTSRSFGDGDLDVHARAAEAGHTIVRGPAHHPLDDLAEVLPTVDAWIAGTGPITTEHLDLAPRLAVIARYGVGVEAVDLAAATERGIVVSNTPGANAEAVADHTVGLALAALRSTVDGDRRVRSGDWTVRRGREIGASTVGIVGFGRIGRGVARRLQGFGSDVLATDPFVPAEDVRRAGAEPATLDEIFAKADVITLHAPGGQVIVDEERIARLRRGAVIVNCARPDLVDEPALAAALADGRVGAYAADVLTGDTAGHDSPLLDAALADRVVITPHLAAQTTQAVDNMGAMALESALAVLAGEPAPYAVTST
jgi:D-3-phosphoglycerate dehydrogenase